MGKRLVTDPQEIYDYIKADAVLTEAVSLRDNKVYVMGSDGSERRITQIEVEDE